MSDAPLNNARRSSRFPVVGNGDGELELPGGMRVPVRIENESAGGFGVFCNADVSVWHNEDLLLLRGGDTFEVRVVHVAEVEIPRRSGEPEPEWLPLRIGLERRSLLWAPPARKRRSWLGRWLVRFDRPGHPSMAFAGVLLTAAFVAAPLLWISAMQSHQQPMWTAAMSAGERILTSVAGWFKSSTRRQQEAAEPPSAWAKSIEEAQRSADAARKELQAHVAPYRDKAKTALGGTEQWLEATARSAGQHAASAQDAAAQSAERLVHAGGNALEKAGEEWESGEFADEWGAALEQWFAGVEQPQPDLIGQAAASPSDERPQPSGSAEDASTATPAKPDGAAPPPAPSKQPPAPSKQPPAPSKQPPAPSKQPPAAKSATPDE